MPTYQYVCANPESKHEFEVVQSFSDPALATCRNCDAPVRKVYGSVGVVFKGSGFYRTDSRKSESSSTSTTSSTPSSAGSSGSGSSSSSTSSSSSGGTSSGSGGKAAS
ncbi:FmdB family zinc ribbon protein [Modestobacter marinus]|uniref:FmdB family zinc ribbon protein n=1 Tax=Modestobacter marinus TaxID=477641 RepID=UPI001C981B36|nr:FmdB family zinc ribbon protein [Modestobacter marinus]